jgi:hypothetical protein
MREKAKERMIKGLRRLCEYVSEYGLRIYYWEGNQRSWLEL